MITAVLGDCWRIRSASQTPSWPGIRMSQSATAAGWTLSRPSASSALAAVATRYPPDSSQRVIRSRAPFSSSTISTLRAGAAPLMSAERASSAALADGGTLWTMSGLDQDHSVPAAGNGVREVEPFEPAVKGAAAQPEHLCRRFLVATGTNEGALDVVTFDRHEQIVVAFVR